MVDKSSLHETHTCQAFTSFSFILFYLDYFSWLFFIHEFHAKCPPFINNSSLKKLKSIKFYMQSYCTVHVCMHGMRFSLTTLQINLDNIILLFLPPRFCAVQIWYICRQYEGLIPTLLVLPCGVELTWEKLGQRELLHMSAPFIHPT